MTARAAPADQPMWNLFCWRDAAATEMLCWHAIGRLRLTTAGRMLAVKRPRWS